uniref:Uncharacterized protein n=1 Tax=Glossina palpalis gambiensis TaxID=67801 RepID=A0A1B0BF74_9MUSC
MQKVRSSIKTIQIRQIIMVHKGLSCKQEMVSNHLYDTLASFKFLVPVLLLPIVPTLRTLNKENLKQMILDYISWSLGCSLMGPVGVEQLVNEMKEVNLQSLTVTPSEEIKHFLEEFRLSSRSNKPGSSRRIIGSPRRLENAVPTNKNPHCVWRRRVQLHFGHRWHCAPLLF